MFFPIHPSPLLIHLRREDKIILAQAIDVMRPNRQFYFAPGEKNVRVMIFRFGDFPNEVGKIQGLTEVFEREFFLQVMLVHHLPRITELVRNLLECIAFKRLRFFLTRFAFFLRKCAGSLLAHGGN